MNKKIRCAFCNVEESSNIPIIVNKDFTIAICLDCATKIVNKYNPLQMPATDNSGEKTETKNAFSPSETRKFNQRENGDRDESPDNDAQIKIMTPSQIKAKLDEYVVGQDDAKRAMAVAVYNHYKRILRASETEGLKEQEIEIKKSNILMCGATGSGKTYLAQTLAKVLDVPFTIADASSMTASGYIGEDITNMLLRLVKNANGNIRKAETGIIYIDEIDKISARGEDRTSRRDIGTEGVQQELLKILEGSTVTVDSRGLKKFDIDTTNILFICGGAFDGMDEILEASKEKHIGFGTEEEEEKTIIEKKGKITPEDLVKYGMLPEIIGRLPIIVTLNKLDREALMSILTKPKGALVKQYKTLFKMDGIDMDVTTEALEEIAEKALKRNMGARGLRSIMEAIMEKGMFEIPDMKGIRKVMVTKETVMNGEVVIETEEENTKKTDAAGI